MKINYFLASWSGQRRLGVGAENYLRAHLKKLSSLKHNLAQISIGCPANPDMSDNYRDFLEQLESLPDGTPIVVYHTPNEGMSYGQYSYMFEQCRDQFTHYILIEDDYVPCVDCFDTTLVEWFDKLYASENCGYLCGLVLNKKGRFGIGCQFPHAAVSNGITSNEVLSTIWDQYECLPHHIVYSGSAIPLKQEQIVFSEAFLDAGYTIRDMLSEYRCLYYKSDNDVIKVFGAAKKDLIVPLQYLQENPTWKLLHFRKEKVISKVRGKRNGNPLRK